MMDTGKSEKHPLHPFDFVTTEQSMRTDHHCKYENGGDDEFPASASDERIEEVGAHIFEDTEDDAGDHGAQNAVEATQNSN